MNLFPLPAMEKLWLRTLAFACFACLAFIPPRDLIKKKRGVNTIHSSSRDLMEGGIMYLPHLPSPRSSPMGIAWRLIKLVLK
ncbi:hypothetical protein B0H65DRAFT_456300 [Neurospora tetraspora]|uniref:Uncharacterized protein n=1 Tax=Neurospora tetraspora TaxID=94610 RepID=A0AAE0MTU6_9PEZI|nr:hypothetical protein B0H65DRAFT_456300 [Neurospora tetraspora]